MTGVLALAGAAIAAVWLTLLSRIVQLYARNRGWSA